MRKSGARRKRKSGARRKVLNPMGCITMRQPLQTEYVENFSICYWSALDGFTKGYGAKAMWQTIADALNIARKLCEDGTGSEYCDDVIAAQKAAKACVRRFKESGKWGLSGDELVCIREALTICDGQYRVSSPLHLKKAMQDVRKSIAKGDLL
jgi:hypothetical protein